MHDIQTMLSSLQNGHCACITHSENTAGVMYTDKHKTMAYPKHCTELLQGCALNLCYTFNSNCMGTSGIVSACHNEEHGIIHSKQSHFLHISFGYHKLHNQRFHSIPRFISEVSFCWWGMKLVSTQIFHLSFQTQPSCPLSWSYMACSCCGVLFLNTLYSPVRSHQTIQFMAQYLVFLDNPKHNDMDKSNTSGCNFSPIMYLFMM